MDGILNGLPPGILGYVQGQQQTNRRDMVGAQQAQTLAGIQSAMLHQRALQASLEDQERQRTLMAEVPAALSSGDPNVISNVFARVAPLQALQSALPKPPTRVDLGDAIGLLDERTMQIVGRIPKGATPDAQLRETVEMTRHGTPSGSAQLGAQMTMFQHQTPSATAIMQNNTAIRGQNMTDARAGLVFDADRGVMVDTRAGVATPVMSAGAPLGPKPEKLGEASVKQITGVNNVRNAIADYRTALSQWKAVDALNPNARAQMGTLYNNMLLQAKEAYNLGVLNGPDYAILQSVITDPASPKGAITSNSALEKQAKKLDELMGRIGQTVSSSTHRPNQATAQPSARTVVRTGTYNGKPVVQYSDGTTEYR